MLSKLFSWIWLWWSTELWQQCNCTMLIAGVQNLGFVHQPLDGGGIVCHKEHFFIVGQHQFSGGQCCCSVRMLFSPLVFHFIFWDMASCAQCQLLHEWMMCTPTCWWAATVVSCFLWWVHTHTCWHSAVSGDQHNCTIAHCANWSEKMIDGAVRGFFVFLCVVSLCVKVQPDLSAGHFLVSSMKPVGLCVNSTHNSCCAHSNKMEKDREKKLRGLFWNTIEKQRNNWITHQFGAKDTLSTHNCNVWSEDHTSSVTLCQIFSKNHTHTQHGQVNHLQVLKLQRTSHDWPVVWLWGNRTNTKSHQWDWQWLVQWQMSTTDLDTWLWDCIHNPCCAHGSWCTWSLLKNQVTTTRQKLWLFMLCWCIKWKRKEQMSKSYLCVCGYWLHASSVWFRCYSNTTLLIG